MTGRHCARSVATMHSTRWTSAALLSVALGVGHVASAPASPGTGLVSVPSESGRVILGAAPGDYLGTALSDAGDVNADGRTDLVTGFSSFSSSVGFSGAGLVAYGGQGGILALSGPSLAPSTGYAFTTAGAGLAGGRAAGVGDVNGDGRPDVAAPQLFGTRIVVTYGAAGPRPTLKIADPVPPAVGFEVTSVTAVAISSAGDFNGDGVGDLLVGTDGVAGDADGAYYGPGGFGDPNKVSPPAQAVVVFGRKDRTGPVDARNLAAADGVLISAGAVFPNGGGALSTSPAGDVNGDGFGDVLLGAPEADGGRGRAFVVLGSAAPPQNTELGDSMPVARGFAMAPPGGGWALGTGVGDVGDVNGDKLADVVVGGPGVGPGFAWIVFGRKVGGSLALTADNFQGGQIIVGPSGTRSRLGAAVDGAGDVNGDGRGDVVLGAPGSSPNALGAAYVVKSLPASRITLGKTVDPGIGFAIRPDASDVGPGSMSIGLGSSVAGLGGGAVAVGAPTGAGGASGAIHIVPTRTSNRFNRVVQLTASLAAKAFKAGSAGTSFVLTTSQPADVRVSLFRVGPKPVCFRLRIPGDRRERCRPDLTPVGGSVLGPRQAGQRSVRFSGRSKGKPLARGRYLAVLRAGAGSSRSVLRTVSFRVT